MQRVCVCVAADVYESSMNLFHGGRGEYGDGMESVTTRG